MADTVGYGCGSIPRAPSREAAALRMKVEERRARALGMMTERKRAPWPGPKPFDEFDGKEALTGRDDI